MKLTSVTVKKVKNCGRIKATADIVFDNAICVRKIALVQGLNEMFISFPYKKYKTKDNQYVDIVHPIKNELRLEIQKKIIEEYNATEG